MHEANDHCGSESKRVPNAQGQLRGADQEHRALDLNAGSYRDGEHLWLTGIADALLGAIAWSQTRLLCVRWFSFGAWTGPVLRDKLDQIIDAAQRAGVVVYTIDARGLVTLELDATNSVPFDPNGGLEIASAGAIAASQDAMNALAEDTGGRALRNTNYFDRWVG